MFNLNDYEDVDSRIHKFYETYPDGAILTEQVLHDEQNGTVLFKAIAYRTHLDSQPSAIGYARAFTNKPRLAWLVLARLLVNLRNQL